MAKVCLKDECNNPRFGKGYCRNHQYLRTDKKPTVKKRTRISPISEKMAENLKVYRILRREFMEVNPNCQLCSRPATDLHHRAGRGKYLNDVLTFMALCRPCHNWIHENPKESRELLYLL